MGKGSRCFTKRISILPNSYDSGVKALCDLLGRIRQCSISEKIEKVKHTVKLTATVPNYHSKEEIVGITLGKDMEHVLPSELALLSDPETAILFDLKYTESNLMCFDMQGVTYNVTDIEEELLITKKEQKGPIIICVDTSGSMHGAPETIAKAITLFLTTTAKKQQRDCYLINFSTDIKTLDLSSCYTLESLLSFLQMSFYGGTDVAPAIKHGINMMEKGTYKNADMLIISDFVMSSLPEDTLSEVERLRAQGNRFYSLCIGNTFMSERLKTHFDREWIYNPARAAVQELISFQENLMNDFCC